MNAVFLAQVLDDVVPHPAAEMPAIVALTEAQVCQAAVGPITWGDLQNGGAKIWAIEPVSEDTLLAPGGSAQWYTTLLTHQKRYIT